jgi:hypothetical protein
MPTAAGGEGEVAELVAYNGDTGDRFGSFPITLHVPDEQDDVR